MDSWSVHHPFVPPLDPVMSPSSWRTLKQALGISASTFELAFDYVPGGAIHEIALGRSSLNAGYRARLLAFKSSKAASCWSFIPVIVTPPATVHPSGQIELTLRGPLENHRPYTRDPSNYFRDHLMPTLIPNSSDSSLLIESVSGIKNSNVTVSVSRSRKLFTIALCSSRNFNILVRNSARN